MEFLTITNVIVGVTCLTSYFEFKDQKLIYDFIFYPAVIKERKEYYRFVTAGFLHGNLIHLAFNMIALYSFGNNVELVFKVLFGPLWGALNYIALYFLAFLASHVFDYITKHNNPQYRALGASGAVSAVVFANILFDPWGMLLIFVIPCPQIIAGIGFLFYSSYMAKSGKMDGIGHNAHLYGALFGLAFTVAIQPALLPHFVECTLSYNKECLMDFLNAKFNSPRY